MMTDRDTLLPFAVIKFYVQIEAQTIFIKRRQFPFESKPIQTTMHRLNSSDLAKKSETKVIFFLNRVLEISLRK